MPKLTAVELEIIERACRAFAQTMEADARRLTNPTVRAPTARIAQQAAQLAERFAKARALRSEDDGKIPPGVTPMRKKP